MCRFKTLFWRIIAVALVLITALLLAHMTPRSMFFSCTRGKPRIEIGYLISLGKIFDEIFLGVMFTVFLNKLLHNTFFLRIPGDAPDVLNRLIISHDSSDIGSFQRRCAATA